MVACPMCHMSYIAGLPEDEKEHSNYHDDVVNGLQAHPLSDNHVVWQENQEYITIINSVSSLSQRNRAEKISRLASLEISSVGGLYCAKEPMDVYKTHLFLFHIDQRAVGVMMLQQRTSIWRAKWCDHEAPDCAKIPDHLPIWSVIYIWVLRKHRRKGLAKTLLAAGIKFFNLSPNSIGWYTPFSNEGKGFVKSICPLEFFIAK